MLIKVIYKGKELNLDDLHFHWENSSGFNKEGDWFDYERAVESEAKISYDLDD